MHNIEFCVVPGVAGIHNNNEHLQTCLMVKEMKQLVKLFTLFLITVFYTSCGQKQTEAHKDTINYSIKDTVTAYGPNKMVRNVKQGRNGNILFAASRGGVFRYDGKSFTNIASKIGSRRYWD